MTSLVAVAAGFCAWRAIKSGETWAEDRVLFEPTDSFDVGTKPSVVIYCESGLIETSRGAMMGGKGRRLRVEAWLAGDTPEGFAIGVSSALPFSILSRQIDRALFVGDKGSWSDLFRVFSGAVVSRETTFDLYETPKGERAAMRALTFTFGESLAEPPFGEPPQGAWAQWLEKMRAETPEMAACADALAQAIQAPCAADYVADLAALGAPTSDAVALGLGAATFPSLANAEPPAVTP